jgi:hypothetical protein
MDWISCDSANDGSILQFVLHVPNSVYIYCMSREPNPDRLCLRLIEIFWMWIHVWQYREKGWTLNLITRSREVSEGDY